MQDLYKFCGQSLQVLHTSSGQPNLTIPCCQSFTIKIFRWGGDRVSSTITFYCVYTHSYLLAYHLAFVIVSRGRGEQALSSSSIGRPIIIACLNSRSPVLASISASLESTSTRGSSLSFSKPQIIFNYILPTKMSDANTNNPSSSPSAPAPSGNGGFNVSGFADSFSLVLLFHVLILFSAGPRTRPHSPSRSSKPQPRPLRAKSPRRQPFRRLSRRHRRSPHESAPARLQSGRQYRHP